VWPAAPRLQGDRGIRVDPEIGLSYLYLRQRTSRLICWILVHVQAYWPAIPVPEPSAALSDGALTSG